MGSNTSFVHPMAAQLRHELGLPETGRLVLYSGRFGMDHPLMLMLDAAPLVMDLVKILHFVMIGDGPNRHRLENEVRRRHLDAAVIFAGDVPDAQVSKYALACDVGLYMVQNVGSSCHRFDVKEIYEFLQAGRPVVVASDVADARCFVQANDVGMASNLVGKPQEDLVGIVKSLSTMLLDDRIRLRRGENARALGKALMRTATGGVLDVVMASLRRAASL